MLLNPILLLPVMLARGTSWDEHCRIVQEQWRVLALIGVCNGIQIGLNNSSLVLMELSLNQVVRAAMPIFVALLAVTVESKVPTPKELATLGLISLGVMLTVFKPGSSVGSDLQGSLLVLCSVATMAAQMSFSGKLGLRLDAVQMTFYTGWMSFLSVVGVIIVVEGRAFIAYFSTHIVGSIAILLSSCAMAAVYNVVVFQTIRGLSSVGSAVLGNVKIAAILLVSAVWMGEMKLWLFRQHVGCVLTFGGAALYSALKFQMNRKKSA